MMQGLAKNTRRAMRRARRKRGTELNLVSMIDVLTVLVFFLLVNQIGVSVLGVELPGPAAASSEPTPPQDLSVVVRADGLVLADNGQPIGRYPLLDGLFDFNGLAARLGELKQLTPDDSRISLLLEPGISYETLVTLMDAVRVDSANTDLPLFPDISVGVAPPTQAELDAQAAQAQAGAP